jgi:hypothetical protein
MARDTSSPMRDLRDRSPPHAEGTLRGGKEATHKDAIEGRGHSRYTKGKVYRQISDGLAGHRQRHHPKNSYFSQRLPQLTQQGERRTQKRHRGLAGILTSEPPSGVSWSHDALGAPRAMTLSGCSRKNRMQEGIRSRALIKAKRDVHVRRSILHPPTRTLPAVASSDAET